MDKKIKSQLEADVQPEDFAQSFQPIISAIGIKAALDLCRYSGGIQQYIPLYDEVTRRAEKPRYNERIRRLQHATSCVEI